MNNVKNYIFIIAVSLLVGFGVSYAFTDSPEIRIEKENKKAIRECLSSIDYESTSNQILRATEICSKMEIKKIINGDKLNNETTVSSASGVIGEASGNKTISLECELGKRTGKVEGIEYHYTATDDTTTLQSIKNSHVSKGQEHIGYHYVIKANGEITNTRDESCIAGADKWSKNNYRFIQIAFIGDDKPTWKQSESMIKLSKILLSKHNLIPSGSTISAHQEWGPKSKHESFDYWYGGKEGFIKRVREQFVVKIYNKESDELKYMFEAWGDLDFIATIYQESRMNNDSIGDGGQSIGYCQIHKGYQPGWYDHYRSLATMQERLNYCNKLYNYAKSLKGGVGSRFHGYNKRQIHIENISIK